MDGAMSLKQPRPLRPSRLSPLASRLDAEDRRALATLGSYVLLCFMVGLALALGSVTLTLVIALCVRLFEAAV
jgi:hypothetical protein